MRLDALKAIGHKTSKINIRVIGGTWSYYTPQYQTRFIKEIFRAANEDFQKGPQATDLATLQNINQSSNHRIVEISIETRQDYINGKEIKRLRFLGITKVELGVQSIYDKVLKINRRGHDVNKTIEATKLLKDCGFKVSYQMMLNLPGSNTRMDEEMFCELFKDECFQPDHLKIYPLALLENTPVFKLYQKGNFKPYNKDELTSLLAKIKAKIPVYCRIERVIRDIPATDIVEGGAKISNLRQIVAIEMQKRNTSCQCIRCREIKTDFNMQNKYRVFRTDYKASGGVEIFLSVESRDRSKLLSFLRLRIPSQFYNNGKSPLPVLSKSAIIREIHTYGPQLDIGEKNDLAAQHHGYGKLLISEAEKITKSEFSLSGLAVISGIGVREYFAKLGYFLDRTYMVKPL